MDRRQIAYLLILLLVVGLAAVVVRARYQSRERKLRRLRLADQKRSASRMKGPDRAG